MFFRFLIIITILLYTNSVSAHVLRGEHVDWMRTDIPKIEAYFKKPLDKTLLIYAVPDQNTYYAELNKYQVKNARELARKSYAVTSIGNVILINAERLSKRHFFFVLAHEMTHQYQLEKYGDKILKNVAWMERDANEHARAISGYMF